jgi:hypothetical protein
MARGVRRWIAVALGACAIVAVGYLPPRGGVTERESRFRMRVPQLTPARLRAQDLALQWRATQAAMTLLRATHDGEWPDSRMAEDLPTVVVDGPDSIASLLRPLLTAAMDTVWRQVGLGATKVGVVVVFAVPRPGTYRLAPAEQLGGDPSYLLPDSTDRTTCAVFIPAGYWTINLQRRRLERDPRFREWLKGALGPCAFYAAYGNPGKPVRRWLARRNFDLAMLPDWIRPGGSQQAFWWLRDFRTGGWWWETIYGFPATTVACLGGRPSGCREAVLEGMRGNLDDSLPRVVTPVRRWWQRQGLVPGERYLADVARDVGRERFLRFWNSPEPVDTALAAALEMPVGEWTARWERRFVPRLPLGPTAPASAALLALLLGGSAVAIVALAARRRQVR